LKKYFYNTLFTQQIYTNSLKKYLGNISQLQLNIRWSVKALVSIGHATGH